MTVYRRIFFGLRGIRSVLKQYDESMLSQWQRDLLKERLTLLTWYDSHDHSLSATARYFTTSRSHVVKLVSLREKGGLHALIPKKPGPRKKRGTKLTPTEKLRIENLARAYPDWSHKKLTPYLGGLKAMTIYRYLVEKELRVRQRCPGYFKKPNTVSHWKIKRIRLPTDYEHTLPGDLVALDSMVEYVGPHRKKLYFICCIDLATRIGIAVASTHHTAREAAKVLQLMREVLQVPIEAVLTDNGSEFLGDFQEACIREHIINFFSRPRTPKDNAVNERFNQTVQRSFYWRCDLTQPVSEINTTLADWLIEYNCLRPHESLSMRPPVAHYFKTFYQVRLHSTIDTQVYPRLWNRTTRA
ncbi:MAG: hypothetical protein A2V81_00005 [Candidatus Abawacabacteria bacterium RBG_16_42_10]|uniref:Integrase catalytic domain-containing protein n=1 Tax=Candidatus Abawacabacteria bacterium RBG_16_42_10 TaxID=1817814 RepID=A0A1F4XK70_9BACT|nr:MAG: hypothetical protein A2V81_00005 [Candidatus Abawacabacteria bacterium RBG_16_42_10]